MNPEAERQRFKEHAPELNLLLWALWNPIGASMPLDEYESYVPPIWNLLVMDAPVEEIAAELRRIEQDQFDSGGDSNRAVAERLKDWWYWRFKYPEGFPHGLDYGWVALDGRGSVGFFTNGGRGPIPAAVIAERPAADEAEGLALQLHERGAGTAVVATPSVPDAYTRFADRGLFVYDWQDVHRVHHEASGCYELVARPSGELTASELPSELARLARLTRLDAIVFEEATSIPLQRYISVARPDDQ